MRNLLTLILFMGMYLPPTIHSLYGQVDTTQSEEWKKDIRDRLKSVGISPADSLTWCDSCLSNNILIEKEMTNFINSVYESDVFFLRLSPHGVKGDFCIRLTIHASVLELKVIKMDKVYMTKNDSSLMVVGNNLLDKIIGGNFMKVGDDYHDDTQFYWINKEGVRVFSFYSINDGMGGFDNETKEALGSNYRIFELLMGFYDKALER